MHYPQILAIDPEPVEFAYDDTYTMLYALGLGYGGDPTHRDELRFVYEGRLQAVPTMAAVMGSPGIPSSG